MFHEYNWVDRIFYDVFTVTILLSFFVGTFLGFINRRGEEKARCWLYLSFFFLSLALFVFFDNTLSRYWDPNPGTYLWRIPLIHLSQYGIFLFSMMALSVGFNLTKIQKVLLIIMGIFIFSVPLLSLSIFKFRLKFYQENIILPIFIIFGIAVFFCFFYFGILLIKQKKSRDFYTLTTFIGITATDIFIYCLKFYQEMNPELYRNQTYLFLVLFLMIFLFLLSGQSHLEYRELKELRKARMLLEENSKNSDTGITSLTDHINPKQLPFKVSEREWQIILGLCNGLLYKEIAFELDISLSSVKKGVHGIYKKADVQNCVELIKLLMSL